MRRPLLLLIPALSMPGWTGCRTLPGERANLASGNPLSEVTAAVWLAERGDPASVARLVALLDDEDPTVRMYAGEALERLCGRTYGYRFHDPPEQRRAALARWQDALRRGDVRVRARSVAASQPAGTASADVTPVETHSSRRQP